MKPPPGDSRAQRLTASEDGADEGNGHTSSGSRCAQRLTASEDGAAVPGPLNPARHQESAQRLTASEDGAATRYRREPARRDVLKALRHQRMVQREVDDEGCNPRDVLNALRHQRMVQLTTTTGEWA